MPKLSEILGESYTQIPEDLKKKYKDIDLVDSSSYVERKELEAVNETNRQYKKDIIKRDNDLLELQGKVKDNKELSTEIENLKIDNKKASDVYEAKLNQINFDNKFEKAIGIYNAKNPKALQALLDMEKVKLVDDTFIGLEEQVKALIESDSYLFAEETKGGTGFIGGGASSFSKPTLEEPKSLGERLAKEKTEQLKGNEQLDGFFK